MAPAPLRLERSALSPPTLEVPARDDGSADPTTPVNRTFTLDTLEKPVYATAVLSAGSDAVLLARRARARAASDARIRLEASMQPAPMKPTVASPGSPQIDLESSSDDEVERAWIAATGSESSFESPSVARRFRMDSNSAWQGVPTSPAHDYVDLGKLTPSELDGLQSPVSTGKGKQRQLSPQHAPLSKSRSGSALSKVSLLDGIQPQLDLNRPRSTTLSIPSGRGSMSRARSGSILGQFNRTSHDSPAAFSPRTPTLELPSSPRPTQLPWLSRASSNTSLSNLYESSPVSFPQQPRRSALSKLAMKSNVGDDSEHDNSMATTNSRSTADTPDHSFASTHDSSLGATPDTSAGSIMHDDKAGHGSRRSNNTADLSISDMSAADSSAELSRDSYGSNYSNVKSAGRVHVLHPLVQAPSSSPPPSPEGLGIFGGGRVSASGLRPKSHTVTSSETPMLRRARTNTAADPDVFTSSTVKSSDMNPERWTSQRVLRSQAGGSGGEAMSAYAAAMSRGSDSKADYSSASTRRMTVGHPAVDALGNLISQTSLSGPSPRRGPNINLLRRTSRLSTDSAEASPGEEGSLLAFQELVDQIVRSPTTGTEAVAVAAAVGAGEFRRLSPSLSSPKTTMKSSCDLCGSLCLVLTTLEPCGHRACPTCTSSGINQVSTSPPRKHTCASCHTPVEGISLGMRERSGSTASDMTNTSDATSLGRPLTPQFELGENASGLAARKIVGGTLAALELSRAARSNNKYSALAEARDSETQPSLSPADASPDSRPSTAKPEETRKTGSLAAGARSFFVSYGDGASTKSLSSGQRLDAGAAQPAPLGKHGISSDVFSINDDRAQRAAGPKTAVTALMSDSAMTSSSHQTSFSRTPFAFSASEFENEDDWQGINGTVVVRVDNIPWTASYNDILEWVPDFEELLPDAAQIPHAIHVPIELPTGKTANSCFIECRDKQAAMKLIRKRNNHRLCGRPVSLIQASDDELLDEIFPTRACRLYNAIDGTFVYFTPWELHEVLKLLRDGSPQLKGPLKVVEYFTSMMRLVPVTLAPDMRSLLFERASEFVTTCVGAVTAVKGLREALDRLLFQICQCAALSIPQKIRLLDCAKDSLAVATSAVPKQQRPDTAMSAAAGTGGRQHGMGRATAQTAPPAPTSFDAGRLQVSPHLASAAHTTPSPRLAGGMPMPMPNAGSPYFGGAEWAHTGPLPPHGMMPFPQQMHASLALPPMPFGGSPDMYATPAGWVAPMHGAPQQMLNGSGLGAAQQQQRQALEQSLLYHQRALAEQQHMLRQLQFASMSGGGAGLPQGQAQGASDAHVGSGAPPGPYGYAPAQQQQGFHELVARVAGQIALSHSPQ